MDELQTYTAFHADRRIAAGTMDALLPALKSWTERYGDAGLLCFEDWSGRQIDFDLRGVMPVKTGPGRPRLGVVSREISLLPRHWEWLQNQPHGASAALRRLVDEARKAPGGQARQAREAAGRFMTAMAGNLPGYEEATRALYAGNGEKLRTEIAGWPEDVRTYTLSLARCEI